MADLCHEQLLVDKSRNAAPDADPIGPDHVASSRFPDSARIAFCGSWSGACAYLAAHRSERCGCQSTCIVVLSRSSHVLFRTRPGTSLVWQALVAARLEPAPPIKPVIPAADRSAHFRVGDTRAAGGEGKNGARA